MARRSPPARRRRSRPVSRPAPLTLPARSPRRAKLSATATARAILTGRLSTFERTRWSPAVQILAKLLRCCGPLSPEEARFLRDALWGEATRRATPGWRQSRVSLEAYRKHAAPGLTDGQLARKLTAQLHLDPPLDRFAARRLRKRAERLAE